MDDIFVYTLQLPLAVKGVVSPDEDGNYTIYINSRYNEAQRRQIYDHEMRHILLGHYTQPDRPITHQEAEASNPALLKAQITDAAAKGLPARPLLTALPAATVRAAQPAPAKMPPARRQPPPPRADIHRLLRQTLTGAYY